MYTQCPECQVAFRVTAEVLQQARGKVRCGSCHAAFNALDHLSESPPQRSGQTVDPVRATENNRQLLDTLKELTGPQKIRIEDTGIEWQVVDDDENTDEGEGDVEETTQDDLAASESAGANGSSIDDEPRYDDNTPLPDDYDDDEDDEPSFASFAPPGRRAEDVVAALAYNDAQSELELGDPDDWANLLDEMPETAAAQSALAEGGLTDAAASDLDVHIDDPAAAPIGAAVDTAVSGAETAAEPQPIDEPDPESADIPQLESDAEEVPAEDKETGFYTNSFLVVEDEDGEIEITEARDEELPDEPDGDRQLGDDDETATNTVLAVVESEMPADDEPLPADEDIELAADDEIEPAAEAVDEAIELAADDEIELAADDEVEAADEEIELAADEEPEAADPEAVDEEIELAADEELEALDGEIELSSDEELDAADEAVELAADESDGDRLDDGADAIDEDSSGHFEILIADAEQDVDPDSDAEEGYSDSKSGAEPGEVDADESDEEDALLAMTASMRIDPELVKAMRDQELAASMKNEDGSPLVETIVMEGDFTGSTSDLEDAQPRGLKAHLSDPASLLDTYISNRSLKAGGFKGKAMIGASVTVLLLALGVQFVHSQRESLATYPLFQKTIAPIYRAIGKPVTPGWDVRGWQFEGVPRGSTDENDELLTISSRLANRSEQPLPYPLVHVSLTDRYEEVVGSRILEPSEYLADSANPGQHVNAGDEFTATITIASNAESATGFKLNVCYRDVPDRVRCAIDDFK